MIIKKDLVNVLIENSNFINFSNEISNIPIINKYDSNLIDYDKISELEEKYGLNSNEVIDELAESNNIDPDSICVLIEESELYNDINCVNYYPNYALYPVSENSLENLTIDSILEEYELYNDDSILDKLLYNDLFIQEALDVMEDPKVAEERRKNMKADLEAVFGKQNVQKHTGNSQYSSNGSDTNNNPKKNSENNNPKKENSENNNPTENENKNQKKNGIIRNIQNKVMNNKKTVGIGTAVAAGGALIALKKRKSIARRISLIKNKILGYENKMKSNPSKAGFFQKIINKLKVILMKLTNSFKK